MSRDGLPVRGPADGGRRRQGGRCDAGRGGLRGSLALPFDVGSIAPSLGAAGLLLLLLLLPNLQGERSSPEPHVVALGDGEEPSSAAGGSSINDVRSIFLLRLRAPCCNLIGPI